MRPMGTICMHTTCKLLNEGKENNGGCLIGYKTYPNPMGVCYVGENNSKARYV